MTGGALDGRRIVCIAGPSRGPLAAARILRDMGADVDFVTSEPLGRTEEILLTRPRPVNVVERASLAALLEDEISGVVHHGGLSPADLAALTAGDVNRVELTWGIGSEAQGSDAASQAVAGVADALGEPDRAPLIFPHRMGEYILGVNAAGMVALFELLGRGGHSGRIALVDLWAYAVGTNWLLCAPKGIPYVRSGRRSPGNGGVYPQRLFQAADGFATLLCRSSRDWRAFLDAMGNPAWGEDPRYQDLISMAILYPDEVDRLVESCTRRHSRAELFALARQHGFPLAPVRTPGEALQDEYLARQRFWARSGDGVRLPGGLWRDETWLPAPSTVDADETGADHLSARLAAPTETGRPLAGRRVLDLSWIWAGPMVGAFLADLGAEVIKVEHEGRLDNMRLRGRLPGGPPGDIDPREVDPLFHNVNRGKKSLLLDLKHPDGRLLFLDLVRHVDIVVESFRPHVLGEWGLTFEDLSAVNPRVVLLSLRGLELDESFGPSGLRSYAPITSSLSGLESTLRYGDSDPVGGMAIGISDPVAGWSGITLLLGALVHQARTGRGGWIRLSQLETLCSVLPEMSLAEQNAAAPLRPVEVSGDDREFTIDGSLVLPADRHGDWPDLLGRAVLHRVKHRHVGDEQLYGHGWELQGTAVAPSASAPVIGEHTAEVLRTVLGMEDAAIEELRDSGVLR